MADYSQKDLPVTMHSEDLLRLDDGTTIRFDTNGEAKDIMLNDDFNATCELFPGNEFIVSSGGKDFLLTSDFGDYIVVSAV
ncbi:MAG: hypothetical protein CVU73_13325 [Deltaproteobacteria bacterium HGW-Deltaproteobacteria-8]|jgi:hypothetical protein|nr:MAG: hypothetical protein CVU73_13325 [Deltaproteobacteria bacterium HGW-Deltaproteobacteria-8]